MRARRRDREGLERCSRKYSRTTPDFLEQGLVEPRQPGQGTRRYAGRLGMRVGGVDKIMILFETLR